MKHSIPNDDRLLWLLQLASPALPVGAYSYSEGLETLVQSETIGDAIALQHWLEQELRYGAIRLEAAALARSHHSTTHQAFQDIERWNHWLSAVRETEELRSQSWQMGRTLVRLLIDLDPALKPALTAAGTPCNFAIAFAIAAAHWQIDPETTVLAYLHTWTTNLINAGVKLVPLGQTQGQKLLAALYPTLQTAALQILQTQDPDLQSCGWGLAIASMQHETLYSRLFRS